MAGEAADEGDGGEAKHLLPSDASTDDLSRWLVHRAFEHDSTSAWGALMERNRRSLILFAQFQLGDVLGSMLEAEDLVQEAWMRVCRAVKSSDGAFQFEYRGPGSLQRWMCRLIRNAAIDKARRANYAGGVERTAPDSEDLRGERADQRSGPSSIVEHDDRYAKLREVIDSLPRKYREVVIAHELGEDSYQEIADRLGYSEANARKLCQRAREYLRERLSGRDWRDFI